MQSCLESARLLLLSEMTAANLGGSAGCGLQGKIVMTKGEERIGYARCGEVSQACDALKLEQKTCLQLCEAFRIKKS